MLPTNEESDGWTLMKSFLEKVKEKDKSLPEFEAKSDVTEFLNDKDDPSLKDQDSW